MSESLITNTTLTSLTLASDDKIWWRLQRTNERMKWDSNPIKQWTDNRIGAIGATQMCELLKTNTTLTSLDLSSDDKI